MLIKPLRGAQLNRSHPLARGLVGCWLFNEGTGDKVFDLSDNGNQGTLTNMDPATDWVGGQDGFALDFDGVDDYILVPSNAKLRPKRNFTISAKINCTDFADYRSIVMHDENGGGDDGYLLRVNLDGTVTFATLNPNGWTAQNITSTEVLIAGQEYELSGSYDLKYILRLYINGIESVVSPKSAAGDVIYSVLTNVNIGRRGGTQAPNTAFMKGKLEGVLFYNRALSASDIQQLYINRYQMFESGVSAGIFGTLGSIGLQGSLISQSKLNGDINVLRSLSGDIISASIFSGSFAGSVLLDGKIYTITDIQGAVVRDIIFNGNVNEITQLAGILNRSINISGNIDSEIDISGILKRNIPFTGNVDSLSDISGMMVRTIEAAGGIKSQTNVNGMLIKNIGLDGRINELINVGGNLSLQNILLLDGKIYSLVDITGTAIRDIIINGNIEEIMQLSGAANRGINIAGDIDSLSDISGSLLRIIGASGNINAQTRLKADIIRNIGLQGDINEFVDTFGDLTLQGILLLNGKIYSLANLSGSAGINISLNSRINALNNFQGAVGILRPLSGGIDSTASLRADIAMIRGLDGNMISGSIIEVDMSMNLALSAQVEAAINFVASAGITIPVDGAIVISSIFSGGLASGVEIIVTTDRRVFIKDTNRRIFMKNVNRRKFLIN